VNPLATAAGLAVLAQLDSGSYDQLEATAARLAHGLRGAFRDAGTAAQVTRAFTLVGVFFSPAPVHNYEDARAADHARYATLFHGLLDRSVYFAPSGYETLFPSLAHTDADIDRTIEAVSESLTA
jgi:glutamate-1-semialdehyde 2,1-aminomutase